MNDTPETIITVAGSFLTCKTKESTNSIRISHIKSMEYNDLRKTASIFSCEETFFGFPCTEQQFDNLTADIAKGNH